MPNPSQSITEYFNARGIKTKNKVRERLNFLGRNSKTTFSAMAVVQAARFTSSNTDVAVLGEAYESGYYKQTVGSLEKTYESVYGDVDYTTPVANDPDNKALLDEIFGNNDNDPTGSVGGLSDSDAQEVIGRSGTTKNNKSSLVERNRELRRTQSGNVAVEDEDTVGVRGSGELDAPIEPIA